MQVKDRAGQEEREERITGKYVQGTGAISIEPHKEQGKNNPFLTKIPSEDCVLQHKTTLKIV